MSTEFIDPGTMSVRLTSDEPTCHALWGSALEQSSGPSTALHEAILDANGLEQRQRATVPVQTDLWTSTSFVSGGEAVWAWLEEDVANGVYMLHLQRVCSPVTQ